MICKYCKKDREYGYKISDIFLCADCATEPFFSLVLGGLGDVIDTSIEMDTATIDGETIDISAPAADGNKCLHDENVECEHHDCETCPVLCENPSN